MCYNSCLDTKRSNMFPHVRGKRVIIRMNNQKHKIKISPAPQLQKIIKINPKIQYLKNIPRFRF